MFTKYSIKFMEVLSCMDPHSKIHSHGYRRLEWFHNYKVLGLYSTGKSFVSSLLIFQNTNEFGDGW